MHYLYSIALAFAFLLLLPIWMIWDNSRRIRNATEAAATALVGKSKDGSIGSTISSAAGSIYPANAAANSGPIVGTANGSDTSDNAKIKLYTASWCGYCKKLAAQWSKLEEMCKDGKVVVNGKTIETIRLDCSEPADEKRIRKDLILKNGEKFEGFPTITLQLPGQRDETVIGGFDIMASDLVKSLKDKV